MYTIETKTNILSQYQNGVALKDLVLENHISKSTLYAWISESFASGKTRAGLTAKQVYGLKCEQIRLQQYNEIYTKTGVTSLSPLGDRLSVIDSLLNYYSLNVLTDALKVRKSTYYSHRKAMLNVTDHYISDEYYKQVITEEYEKAKGRFGAKKIHVKLS